MKKYKITKEGDNYNFYTRSCFFFWERKGSFNNMKGLISYINNSYYFLHIFNKDIEWKCPRPEIKDWHDCNFNLEDYVKLSKYNKDVTDTADRTLVLNETTGQYLIEDKPYNSYEGVYQDDYCLPLWSRNNLPLLLEELKKVKAKDDQVIRVKTKYFYSQNEYEQWRNCYPKYKILNFRGGYGCTVTYEYKRADGSCDWEDKTQTSEYIRWIENIFHNEKIEQENNISYVRK